MDWLWGLFSNTISKDLVLLTLIETGSFIVARVAIPVLVFLIWLGVCIFIASIKSSLIVS
jgi:hypothetical protein